MNMLTGKKIKFNGQSLTTCTNDDDVAVMCLKQRDDGQEADW